MRRFLFVLFTAVVVAGLATSGAGLTSGIDSPAADRGGQSAADTLDASDDSDDPAVDLGSVEREAESVSETIVAALPSLEHEGVDQEGDRTDLTEEQRTAAREGAREGARLADDHGETVDRDRRDAAVDAAVDAAASSPDADTEQIRHAAKGGTHGALIQEQAADVDQVQSAVRGSTTGALQQRQDVTVEQIQSGAYGAAFGALIQHQTATVEQVQHAAHGAASGGVAGAKDGGVTTPAKIQEGTKGAAYGSLLQAQDVTVEQIQHAALGASHGTVFQSAEADVKQVQMTALGGANGALTQTQDATLEQIQHAAQGACAGALSQHQEVSIEQLQYASQGAAKGSLTQEQDVSVEQIQHAAQGAAKGSLIQVQDVTVEQIQHAAQGAAAGSLTQRQDVSVEQIQHAARGGAKGSLTQVQDVTVEQIQHAARGACAGALMQAQEASVEQIQHAAEGAATGSLIQGQRVSVRQVQHAAQGAAKGSLTQVQDVTVEQIQYAARGAATGSLEQAQKASVEQIQHASEGAASGSLTQAQRASVEQIQHASQGAASGSLEQAQRASVEQVQHAAHGGASGGVQGAVQHQVTDVRQIQHASHGAASGAVTQVQVVNVVQIQYAAQGAAAGSLSQHQETTVEQIQAASTGASKGALIQSQEADVRQIQAAARGASAGGVTQVQVVNVVQIQVVTQGAATGAISQHQEASVEQIQYSARGVSDSVLERATEEISPLRLQFAAQGSASESAQATSQEGVTEPDEIERIGAERGESTITEPPEEPSASVAFPDQTFDGTTVTVETATLEEGGYVVIHDAEALEGGISPATVRGASAYLGPGEHESVTIELDEPVGESVTLAAVAHEETGSDGANFALGDAVATGEDEPTFDFVETNGAEDTPYLPDGEPVVDGAEVTTDEELLSASVTVEEQPTDGTNVTVSAANLSAGGFLAVHDTADPDVDPDDVIGETAYLEPGEHENVTVALDDPIEETRTLTVVAHRDTDADGVFDFVETAGDEDGPYVDEDALPIGDAATVTVEGDRTADLEVTDQTGDGETVTVDRATATVEYYVDVQYDGQAVETEVFEADDEVENLTVDLDPPLEENTTVGVRVLAAADDEVLSTEEMEYAVEVSEPEPEPTAELTVSDQEGGGETLTVERANASVEYAVVAEYDDERVERAFDATESVTDLNLTLEPPLEEDATVEVSVVDVATDTALENETIEYSVVEEPTATLTVSDQAGDGETLTVAEASATVEYYVEIRYDGEVVQSETFDADETVENRSIELEPPLEEDATVEVGVHAVADDEELTAQEIEYTVEEPVERTAELVVEDQTENGTELTVERASANVDIYVDVHYGDETVESEVFDADQEVRNHTMDLEPPLEEDATVEVAVHAAADDEELAAEEIQYTIERIGELVVEDQTDDGGTVTVDQATANTGYYVDVHYDGEVAQSETFDADETIDNLSIDLEPPLEADTTIEVGVHAVEDDEELAAEEIEYTIERTAELTVTDQTADGETLTVDRATANADFYVEARYDDETVESEVFDADEEVENVTLDLEPPLEDDSTVEVAVHAVADGEELVAQEIEYTVEADPTAGVTITDQESDGTTVVVESVEVSDGGFVAIYDGTAIELDTGAVDPEAIVGVSEYVEPGEHEDLEVTLFEDVPGAEFERDALEAGDHELVAVAHRETTDTQQFEFVVTDGAEDEPYFDDAGEPVTDDTIVTVEVDPTAELSVPDQTDDGTTLVIDRATANVDFYVEARYDGETVESEVFDADQEVEDLTIGLEPPLEDDSPVEVAVHAAEGDEQLAAEQVQYTVELPVEFRHCTAVEVRDAAAFDELYLHVSYLEGPWTDAGDYLSSEDVESAVDGPIENGTVLATDDLYPYSEFTHYVDFAYLSEAGEHPEEPEASEENVVENPHPKTLEDCQELGFGERPTADVTFADGEFDGTTATIDAVSLSEGGFVALYEADAPIGEENVLGVSEYLEAGDHQDVTVALDEPVQEDLTLVAVVHRDLTGDQQFSFADVGTTGVHDGPYLDANAEPITDEAQLELSTEFAVSIVDAPETVEPGEPIEVVAEVANLGDAPGETTIALDVGERDAVDSVPVELEPEEPTTLTLVYEPTPDEVGDLDLTVRVDDPDLAAPDEGTDAVTVTVAEPAEFVVTDIGAPEVVEAGQPLEVTAEIQNQGGVTDTREIWMEIGGQQVAAESIELDGGEQGTVTFSYQTGEGDVGTHDVSVHTADDTAALSVTVEEPGEPEFAVEIVDAPETVEVGQPLEVVAEVANIGDAPGEGDVVLDVGGLEGADGTSVSLAPGEAATVALGYQTGQDDAGTYDVVVRTADDTAVQTVTIEEPGEPEFAVAITDVPESVQAGQPIEVVAEVTNVGEAPGEGDVVLDVGGFEAADGASVSLTAGETAAFAFTIPTDQGDVGDVPIAVRTIDDQATTSVTVTDPSPDDQQEGALTMSLPSDRVAVADERQRALVTNLGSTGLIPAN